MLSRVPSSILHSFPSTRILPWHSGAQGLGRARPRDAVVQASTVDEQGRRTALVLTILFDLACWVGIAGAIYLLVR